jgi:hypothetical protein
MSASSRLMTITGVRAITTISTVSNIDWCLTAIRNGPGGISPSTRVRMPSTCSASQWWKRAQPWTTASIARVLNKPELIPAAMNSSVAG